MGYFTAPDLVIDHLYLGSFPAIDQVVVPIECYHLAGGMAVKGRYSRIIAKNGNSEHPGLQFDVLVTKLRL